MPNVFAPQIFFIVFRETLETSIVVSVLLSFVKQQLDKDSDRSVYRKLRNQVSTAQPANLVSPPTNIH